MRLIQSLLESSARQLDLFDHNADRVPADHDWQVRISKRARHLRINVHPDGRVEVVAPPRAKAREIEAFVAEHRSWISRQRQRATPIDRSLPARLQLPMLELDYELTLIDTVEASAARVVGGQVIIEAPANQQAARLQQWLKATARAELSPLVQRLSIRSELRYEKLQWRLQKTRWGSCSSNRTISLNAAIALLAPELAEYVILHELCHLKYMSHGVRFWGLLSRHCGQDARALDRQLDRFSLDQVGWLHQ